VVRDRGHSKKEEDRSIKKKAVIREEKKISREEKRGDQNTRRKGEAQMKNSKETW